MALCLRHANTHPGSYTLYTYMMKQRSKVMRDLKSKTQ